MPPPTHASYWWRLTLPLGLAAALLFMLFSALAPAAQAAQSPSAPQGGETCFATFNDGATVYSSTTAQAVRDAVGAAVLNSMVKIAGTCSGVQLQGGTTQTVRITQRLTLAGGYTTSNWSVANPVAYPTTLDAQNGGRVLIANAGLTLTNLILQNGRTSGSGGGALLNGAETVVLAGVTFSGNTATTSDPDSGGGGLYAFAPLVVINTRFMRNTASNDGGGAYFANAVTVTGTTFENNRSLYGAGVYFNHTTYVTNTLFLANTANANGGGAHFGGANRKQLVNTLFARNTAFNEGAAIYVNNSAPLALLHATIVSPTLVGTQAIFVQNGTLYFTNTIVASHTVGIYRLGGGSTTWNTLFFGNLTDTMGGVTNTNPVSGNPAFINPALDNYHLAGGSAAINTGVTPLPLVGADFEGDARPQGPGFDIGYDEALYRQHLPFITR